MTDTYATTRDGAAATMNHAAEIRHKYSVAKTAMADLAGEVGKAAVDRAGDMKSHATDWLQNRTKTLRERATHSQAAMISLVRKNPYKAVAAAALAGVVLGMLIRRRR